MPFVLTAQTNPGVASFTPVAVGTVVAGKAVMTTQTVVVAAPGVLATDIVSASIDIDDTGGTLISVIRASAGADTVTLKSLVPVCAGDGVIGFVVFRPIA